MKQVCNEMLSVPLLIIVEGLHSRKNSAYHFRLSESAQVPAVEGPARRLTSFVSTNRPPKPRSWFS